MDSRSIDIRRRHFPYRQWRAPKASARRYAPAVPLEYSADNLQDVGSAWSDIPVFLACGDCLDYEAMDWDNAGLAADSAELAADNAGLAADNAELVADNAGLAADNAGLAAGDAELVADNAGHQGFPGGPAPNC